MARAGYGNRVEGVHAVTAAVEAGRVLKLFVERRRIRRPEIAGLIETLGRDLVIEVEDTRSISQTETPQGLVAECRVIPTVSLDSLATDAAALLVLDHVEDPHNLGAIARSAVAAGITGLVMSERRSAPLSATAFKAASGALELLPVSIVGSIPEAARRLKQAGIWIVGLESRAGQSLFGLELLTEPVAVIVGAEGSGLSHLARERCDVVAHIPMSGNTESLNASVSAALASFEIMRARTATTG